MSFNKVQLNKDSRSAKASKKQTMPKDNKSIMGYRDDSPYRNEAFIDINTPTGVIDMSATGIPIMANGRILPPYSGKYQFGANVVREIPLAQQGGDTSDYFEAELDDAAIEEYKKRGYHIEYVDKPSYQEGGNPKSEHGWDYKQEGDKYLTKRTGTDNWITAKGKALNAIRRNVYNENVPAIAPSIPNASSPSITPNVSNAPSTPSTSNTFSTENAPTTESVSTPTSLPNGPNANTITDGYMPVLTDYGGPQKCMPGKECSFNTSAKIADLMKGVLPKKTIEKLWADDSWYNKDKQLKNDGQLIFETDKQYDENEGVPKDLYSKLQIGDYVQLDRGYTGYEEKGDSDEGYSNDKLSDHQGFIIGKDEDGTPLVWHGSAGGQAFINRIDDKIVLGDPEYSKSYKVTSIVRNPEMKNIDPNILKKTQYKAEFAPYDEDLRIVPNEDLASETQKKGYNAVNKFMFKFKDAGYSQKDIAMTGQLLVGGIMDNESSKNEGTGYWKRTFLKQPAATYTKSLLPDVISKNIPKGKQFEGDEASWGVYQIKPNYNFKKPNGELNDLGKKLQKLGVEPDQIFDNVQNQTIAGQLILLDNYEKLKMDPKFDQETGKFDGKVPASYILAKSWQAGSGWQNRDDYKDYLNDYDITYSNNALDAAARNSKINTGANFISDDFYSVKDAQIKDSLKKSGKQLNKETVQNTEPTFYNNQNEKIYDQQPLVASESTNVNVPAMQPYDFKQPTYEPKAKSPLSTLAGIGMGSGVRKGTPAELRNSKASQQKAWLDRVQNYKNGGEFEEVEMDDNEIAYYRSMGYTIEEI